MFSFGWLALVDQKTKALLPDKLHHLTMVRFRFLPAPLCLAVVAGSLLLVLRLLLAESLRGLLVLLLGSWFVFATRASLCLIQTCFVHPLAHGCFPPLLCPVVQFEYVKPKSGKENYLQFDKATLEKRVTKEKLTVFVQNASNQASS